MRQTAPGMNDAYFNEELRKRIRTMSTLKNYHATGLYKALKEELRPLGHWKAKHRGGGFKIAQEGDKT